MRPIWAGSLSFGLVNIPVKLYLAAKSERFSFRMLHGSDQGPVQFKRFCSLEDREVPYDEIVRGYEYDKGQYLVIEDKDFDRIERAAARVVDIQQFVGREEISPMFYETPYYLEPAKGAERAYALLRQVLAESGKVGIAKVVLKEREYVGAVTAEANALVLHTLRYQAEIRELAGLNIPEEVEVPQKQQELARLLVDQLSGKFDASKFEDTYHQQVAKMIDEKLAGMPIPKRPPAPPPGQVVDLAEVLRRSLEKGKAATAPKEKAERGERRAPQKLAAKTARKRSK